MGIALAYVIVLAGVAALVFVLAAAVFGRGEELAPLAPDATPTRLPAREVRGADVRDLRFQQVLRGYRMAEVDWVLDRLAGELDRVRSDRHELADRVARLEATIARMRAEEDPGDGQRQQW
ncbi:DivIVA domain-containing protein [Pseudonocardia sp. HH130629-09]|uniref:DivIVA domain-containing protein n=1 Tax=Pseudonocardia sp. HH130629-09 TaxID=1641402 RepID=UPI0006CB203A|nr:DivIVA domain-containing protein [Pseudonocardia sp. HH130629-09]ALE85197.1 cell division protein DivIVA [Pseudonocardia sp. HH130629-09]